MQFTLFTFLLALFVAITAVSAAAVPGSNAHRLAHGMGPARPRNLGTPVGTAQRRQTSPVACPADRVHCCAAVEFGFGIDCTAGDQATCGARATKACCPKGQDSIKAFLLPGCTAV